MADCFKEFVAVGVDLFDLHGGDDQTELTENNVLGKLLDLTQTETQQTLRGILHDARLGGNTDRKAGGNVDSDILTGKRVCQVDIDGNRRQVKVLIVLNHRPDKSRAAVNTLGRHTLAVFVIAYLTVDDHDLVRGTLAVPRQHDGKHAENEQRNHCQCDQYF